MYFGEVEDLTDKSGVSESEKRYIPPSVRFYLTPLDTSSKDKPNHHIMVTIKLVTDNNYPSKLVLLFILN